jgi:hypothetical protein
LRRVTQFFLTQTFKKLTHHIGSGVGNFPSFLHEHKRRKRRCRINTREGDRRRLGYGGEVGGGEESHPSAVSSPLSDLGKAPKIGMEDMRMNHGLQTHDFDP